jgi:hypothetical protein
MEFHTVSISVNWVPIIAHSRTGVKFGGTFSAICDNIPTGR